MMLLFTDKQKLSCSFLNAWQPFESNIIIIMLYYIDISNSLLESLSGSFSSLLSPSFLPSLP